MHFKGLQVQCSARSDFDYDEIVDETISHYCVIDRNKIMYSLKSMGTEQSV